MWKQGENNLITDVPGILVGNAHDQLLKSGVSVLCSQTPMITSYAVMGGAPGTRDTDLLEPDKTVQNIDAIVLSGGSAFGLDAASGVTQYLREKGRGFSVGPVTVPIVPTAILFDLTNGGQKNWDQNPYPDLGYRAIKQCSKQFEIGSYGAGYGALCGMLKGGLGSASCVLNNGIIIGALVAVNPVGNPIDPQTGRFWAAPFEISNEYGALGSPDSATASTLFDSTKMGPAIEGANTTIGIIATNTPLTKAQAKRLAITSHDGFSRAILPSHLPFDGDLIFATSTGLGPSCNEPMVFGELCHAASATMSRAIARAVYHATPNENDTHPTWKTLYQQG